MHKSESVLGNGTSKILWNFKIQVDHLILNGRIDRVLINKKNVIVVYFTVLADHCKNKRKRKDRQILGSC